MDEATSLLFDLDGFRVVSVVEVDGGYREALVEGVTGEQACPDCGVFSARVHSRTVQRVKDLPYGRPLVVRWHSGGGRVLSRRAGGGRSASTTRRLVLGAG